MQKEMIMVNGEMINVATVMDKSVVYNPTYAEYIEARRESYNLLNKYFENYLNEGKGLTTMFHPSNGRFWKAKGWIIEAMKKHPCYNGKYQIILRNQDMTRYLNEDEVFKFTQYCLDWVREDKAKTKCFFNPHTGEILSEEVYQKTIRNLKEEKAKAHHEWALTPYGTKEEAKWENECRRLTDEINLWEKSDDIKKKEHDMFRESMREIRNRITGYKTHIVDEEAAERLNEIVKGNGFRMTICAGQKYSKVVQKLAKAVGIDKHVDIQDVSFTRADGEVIHRTKDMGWNHQYATFSDSINPTTVKGTAVISVHYIDFWTMSFGKNWASCHTIDKQNRRRVSSNHYSGCYCGGTESYMLDTSSVIFYFLPDDFNGDHAELQDKIKRCVFYLGEDKLIQSRVYPDGRDGGDKSLAGDIRRIMQKVVSEIFDVPNYWKLEKGTDACCEVITTRGSHYPDYEHYDDCNVSYLKRIDGYLNKNDVIVGAAEICPECGEEHYTEDNIFCEDCRYPKKCYNCGERLGAGEGYYVDDQWYCEDCVTVCDDCEEVCGEATRTERGRCVCNECLERNYTWSSWLDEYVEDDDLVITEEGRECSVYDGTGFEYCEGCDEYHDDDEGCFDEETDAWYCSECYDRLIAEREAENEEE